MTMAIDIKKAEAKYYTPIKRLHRFFRRLWIRVTCKHTHWITFYCDPEKTYFTTTVASGQYSGMLIEGCKKCGIIRFRDWKE